MMSRSRRAQPDLLLAKLTVRLQPEASPQLDAAIEALAGLVMVGVVYTFVVLLYVIGGPS